ncbi:MAG: nicotinate-nucleotide--dimethylbenzimidazole phosphoribosyltransferase [Pelosinus sp.]|nr:nicotinate-nucleotide--dimethylbenzimidazole phosphoribosyltransferase [Pelosinus sp.]
MIEKIIAAISPLDNTAMAACQERIDNLTKPLSSLQGFEELAVQLAGITGKQRPREFKAGLVLMAGDEGVELEEGCSGASDLVRDFCQGNCPIGVLAEHVAADVMLVDIGVAADLSALPIEHKKVAYGTKNFTKGAAMSYEEARSAAMAGINIAREASLKGYSVLGIGGLRADESLASLAVIAKYSEKSIKALLGLDTNNSPSLRKKAKMLEAVLEVNAARAADPFDILSKVGNFEMAGLVGVILGAAANKTAIVLDGLLASAAALIAAHLAANARLYLIGSHRLPGSAHSEALKALNLNASLELDLTLGQGMGAAFGISLLRASLHMLNDMKTFSEAKVAVAEDGPGAKKQKV